MEYELSETQKEFDSDYKYRITLKYKNHINREFNNANEDEIRTKSLEQGMVSLRESGLRKVLDGTTSIQEILRSTVEEI